MYAHNLESGKSASKGIMSDEEYWAAKLKGCKEGVWLNRNGITNENGSGIILDFMSEEHYINAHNKILRYSHIADAMECLGYLTYFMG